jgi:hypothetical protein
MSQDETSRRDELPKIEGYECVEVLGEGSMGRTYLAINGAGERVALKQLYPSRLAKLKDLELFMREAQTLKRLEHAQIPAYVDAFEQPDVLGATCYYLAQQYIPGRSLRQTLRSGDRFDLERAMALLRSLLEVLDYIHAQEPSVVHRDIKPENILLDPETGTPSLVDFGAVREVVRLTMGGGSTIIGTYGYMPPEQLMGRALPPSDLYAVGVTVLECLTKQTPDDLTGRRTAALIEGLNAPENLKRILRRLCAPSLGERYPSARQALDDLDHIHEAKLVHAAQLEHEIAQREAQLALELKRASAPPGVHWGYVLALSMILGVGALALYFVATAVVAMDVGAGMGAAVIMGSLGLLSNLLLVLQLYKHDAWDPPSRHWVRTRGRVQTVVFHEVSSQGDPFVHWDIVYTFPVGGRTFKQTLVVHEEPLASLNGMEFDVYYPPGKPQNSEIVDFLHIDHALLDRVRPPER